MRTVVHEPTCQHAALWGWQHYCHSIVLPSPNAAPNMRTMKHGALGLSTTLMHPSLDRMLSIRRSGAEPTYSGTYLEGVEQRQQRLFGLHGPETAQEIGAVRLLAQVQHHQPRARLPQAKKWHCNVMGLSCMACHVPT